MLQEQVWIWPDERYVLEVLLDAFQTLGQRYERKVIRKFEGPCFFVLSRPCLLLEFQRPIEHFFAALLHLLDTLHCAELISIIVRLRIKVINLNI